VVGWDSARLAMITAVLDARCGFTIAGNDVYLNVAGGLRVGEPAADLAVAAALVSGVTGVPVPHDAVVFGEIGLAGEVRQVGQSDARLKEALRLGFQQALVPARRKAAARRSSDGLALREIDRLSDLVELLTPVDRNPVPRKLPRAVP
jgi:DNA repair protein RadA/Sms